MMRVYLRGPWLNRVSTKSVLVRYVYWLVRMLVLGFCSRCLRRVVTKCDPATS